MIRVLANPPQGWNGRLPPPPKGALDVNVVDSGGPKIAAYWTDDDTAMTPTAWATYVQSTSYAPTVEEVNEQRILEAVTEHLATLRQIRDSTGIISSANLSTAVRALARGQIQVIRLLTRRFEAID